jgi:hypothetical protein
MPRTANKKSAKKTPAKRKYTKKQKQIIDNIEFATPDFSMGKEIKKELDEIEFIDAIVVGMEQLLPEQKSRIINYIYSRYWMYITLSKLTQ